MKKTRIFLPKLLYAAIFISVVFELVVLGAGERLSEESDVHQQANNQYQGVSDRGLDVNIFQINSRYSGIHLNYSRSQVASINDIIPKVEFIVNKRNLRVFDPFSELGIIKDTPNQPAAKLISNSEMTERKVDMFRNAITGNYTSSTLRSGVYQTEKISAAGWEILAGAGFAEAVDERRQDYQGDSQSQNGHSQINDSQLVHDIFFATQTARNQKVAVAVEPNNSNTGSTILSRIAGRTIEPKPITPISTQMLTTVWNWFDVNSGRLGTNTNNSSAIEENSNTVVNWLSMLAPRAYAAETASAKPIPLSLYQPLAGQIMFREALEKIPVEQRTPERIAELITGISQLLSSFPAKGEIFLADGKFSGLTGTAGILSGKVVKGTYRIKIDPVEGIDLIVPAAIEAGFHGSETVMIGLTPGKGKVKTAGEIRGLQKVWQMIWKTGQKESQVLGTQVQSEIGDALPTAPLTIQLFRDENKNGVYDSGESLVEWAGVKMDLEPITQSSSYNLTEGWNLIAFPVALTSVTTAAEAVQDIAKEGGYVTTISTWEGDKWIEYSQRGSTKFGHDFKLEPGRAYFLESQLNSVWTVAGRPVEADKLIFDLSAGWNGVGILREDSTAVQTLDAIQSTKELSSGEVADQMAKWNFGLWDVVVKRRYSTEHHEVYGRDFPVKSIEGYFLHLNQDTKLKFQ